MGKKKAVVLHFLASLAVVSTLLVVIFFVWYPAPFFRISGAAGVLKTLIGVDLVLGPALTAYLYRPGKKGLWIDMWFIAVVQLSALVYGASVIYSERPQYLVFSVDRFTVLAGRDLRGDVPAGICDAALPPPCVAVAVMPDAPKDREAVLFRTLEEGIELEQQPQYWQPLDSAKEQILSRAGSLQSIIGQDAVWRDEIDALLQRHQRAIDTLRYVPVLKGNLDASVLVIDAKEVTIVDALALDPWQVGK